MIKGRKELSESLKTAIIVLKEKNYSMRQISKDLSISKSTISKFWRYFLSNNTIHYKKRAGRPKVLDDKIMKKVIKNVELNREKSSNEIAKDLKDDYGISISSSTIRRRLLKEGLNSRKIINKPKLTKKQKDKRLEWAKKYKDFNFDDWSRVLFSDETKLELYGGNKQGRIRRRSFENPLIVTSEKVKFPTTILVWGCISSKGTGMFEFIEKTLNSDGYIKILDGKLLNSCEKLEINAEDLIFQQDNAPRHTSKVLKKYFADKKIEVMDWPANSADLNPIENLWSLIKYKIIKSKPQIKRELIENFIKLWNEHFSDPTTIQNLIQSMPKRCKEVIKNKGNVIDY